MNAPSRAGTPNKPTTSQGFETYGTGDADTSGRQKAATAAKAMELIHMSMILKDDKASEISAEEPPIMIDVTHIKSDCIIVEL